VKSQSPVRNFTAGMDDFKKKVNCCAELSKNLYKLNAGILEWTIETNDAGNPKMWKLKTVGNKEFEN